MQVFRLIEWGDVEIASAYMEKSFCDSLDSRSHLHIYIDLGKQIWIQAIAFTDSKTPVSLQYLHVVRGRHGRCFMPANRP